MDFFGHGDFTHLRGNTNSGCYGMPNLAWDDVGHGAVTEQRLYQLIRQRMTIVDRQFEIEFLVVGVETFAFTFG